MKSCVLCKEVELREALRFLTGCTLETNMHPFCKDPLSLRIQMPAGTTQLWKYMDSIPGTHIGAFALFLIKTMY